MTSIIEGGACGSGCPREVYIGSDGRERCLWLQMTEIGVCGPHDRVFCETG
jgi:hypothetical protein